MSSYSANIVPAMTSNTSPTPYVVTASYSTFNYEPWKAFNHVKTGDANGWVSPTPSIGSPSVITIDLGAGNEAAVASYQVTTWEFLSTNWPGSSPSSWTLQGSNDGVNFDILDTKTGETNWVDDESRNYGFSNTTSYRYYRMEITANDGNSTWCMLNELELYTQLTSIQLTSILEQNWGHVLLSSLNINWTDIAILKSNLNIYWRSSKILQSNLNELWEDAQRLKSVIEQDWRIYGTIQQELSQRWAVLQGKIISELLQSWDVKTTTPLLTTLNQFWDIQQDGAITQQLFFFVQIGGVQIKSFTDCQAGLDNTKAFNVATIKISSRSEYQSIVKHQNVVITQLGVEFHYFVAGKDSGWSISKGGSSPEYTEEFLIRCESKTAALHKPYATTINRGWPAGGSAKAIIEEMADFENITVDFQVDDFLVPADYLTAENNTPWEVIQKITGPMRLQEQTLPDGTLIIRKSFEDDPAEWDTLAPFYLLSADGGFNKYTEQDNEDQEIYNMVTVQDAQEGTVKDNIIIESEDISSIEKRIRVWEVPWVGTFELKHSGGDSVSIIKNGVETKQLDEQAIEIVDGQGSVSKPCYGISSFSFQENNLTGMDYSEDGKITTTVVGNSLVNVIYTTKYQEFIVKNTSPEKVQIYINGRQT